jgi:Ca-activated chloride channel family protein
LVPDPRTGSYHKDSLGNSVLGRLNESSLKQLVAANGGQYERVGVGDGDIVSLVKVLGVQGSSSNNKSQDPSARKVIVIYNELGWLLCAISLVLLAYVCFKAPQTMALCLLLFWSFFNCNFLRAEDQEVTIAPSERAAFEAYEKGDYGTAKLGFENALGSGDTAKRRLRAGSADFKLGNFESAAKHFAEAEKLAQNGREKFESLYDAGNVALAVRQFDRAIEMYDKALALKSGDEAARGNQALARQLLQQEQQKQEQKQDKSGKPEESKESSKSQEGQGSEDQQDQGKEADSSHRPQDSAQSQSNNQSSDDHKNTEGEESKESGDQQQGQVKSADDPATNDQSSGQQDPSDEQAEQQSAKGVANDDKQSDTDRGSQEQQPQETPNPSPSANPEYPKETEAASSARPGVEDQKSNGTPDGSESENGGSDPAVSEPEGKEVKGSSSSAKTNAGSKQLSSAELKAEAAKRWLDSLPDSPILLQRHAGESFGGSQEW